MEWALAAAFLLLAFLLGCVVMVDTDIWWHLRTGQLIWQRGEIPQTDWFTYTNPDSPWIDLHWGFQLIVVGLWAAGGAAALILAKSAVGTLTYVLMMLTARRAWPLWHTVACLLPSLLLFAGRYYVRPEMASLLFLAATLCVLFHVRRKPWLVWLLPAIQLVWVNVHALFVLGLVAWAIFLLDAAVRRMIELPTPESEQGASPWKTWLAASGLMTAAVFCNPYGLTGVQFPLVLNTRISGSGEPPAPGELSTREFYKQLAGEFQSLPDFIDQYGGISALFTTLSTLMLVLLAGLAVLSFALLAWRKRFSLYRAVLLLAFGYLVWQASRNSVLFAVVAGMVIRLNFGDYFALVPAKQPVRRLIPGRIAIAALVGLLLIAVPTQLFSFVRRAPTALPNYRWFGLSEFGGWYPHDGVNFLRGKEMPPRVYAMHLGHAALYIYEQGPERKVFADPRLEVNTRETLKHYLDVIKYLSTPGGYDQAEELLRGPDGGPLPALLFDPAALEPYYEGLLANPRWRLVYYDITCAVFLYDRDAARLNLPRANAADLNLYISELRAYRQRQSGANARPVRPR